MRINFRYGVAVGIVAAAFSTLGPVAAQAGQNPGTSVPTGARAVSVQAPAKHLLAITGKSPVLSSAFERQAWQHDNGIAQREDNNVAIGRDQLGFPRQQLGSPRQQLGLPRQQDQMAVKSYRCGDWGSWRYSGCRYPDHRNCWWVWGWYDHYHHYHAEWHWYCRSYGHHGM